MRKGPKPRARIDLFNAKIKRGDGCWEWTGFKSGGGYGYFNLNQPMHDGKRISHKVRAHRMAYEITYGAIPIGMHVLHKCDNRSCVRPDHLFLGTHADNLFDMALKGRSGRKKLTPEAAYAILWRKISGGETAKLADEYGVAASTVRRIANRKMWPSISVSYD